MSDANKLLLVGLPESGKTSFLAAFVNYVDSDIAGKSLHQYQISSNATYINLIVQEYLSGKKQQRTRLTSSTTPNTITDVFLERKDTKFRFTLNIPDVHGEVFENQFVDRFIEESYLEQVKKSSGLLLFIHPINFRPATLIEDIKTTFIFEEEVNQTTKSEQSADQQAEQKPKANASVEFDPAECPTQITLVDLLESHSELMRDKPIQVAVIVSAWDTIKKDLPDLSPMKWIEKTVPLLYQYLLTNNDKIVSKVYGVSAEGGDLSKDEVVKQLTALNEPTDRIIVQEEDKTHNNIAAPIEWIIDQWQLEVK